MGPMQIAGATFGLVINRCLPVYVIMALLVLLLLATAYKTTKQVLRLRKQSRETRLALREKSLLQKQKKEEKNKGGGGGEYRHRFQANHSSASLETMKKIKQKFFSSQEDKNSQEVVGQNRASERLESSSGEQGKEPHCSHPQLSSSRLRPEAPHPRPPQPPGSSKSPEEKEDKEEDSGPQGGKRSTEEDKVARGKGGEDDEERHEEDLLVRGGQREGQRKTVGGEARDKEGSGDGFERSGNSKKRLGGCTGDVDDRKDRSSPHTPQEHREGSKGCLRETEQKERRAEKATAGASCDDEEKKKTKRGGEEGERKKTDQEEGTQEAPATSLLGKVRRADPFPVLSPEGLAGGGGGGAVEMTEKKKKKEADEEEEEEGEEGGGRSELERERERERAGQENGDSKRKAGGGGHQQRESEGERDATERKEVRKNVLPESEAEGGCSRHALLDRQAPRGVLSHSPSPASDGGRDRQTRERADGDNEDDHEGEKEANLPHQQTTSTRESSP